MEITIDQIIATVKDASSRMVRSGFEVHDKGSRENLVTSSDLAVQYIYERFRETYFSINAKAMEVEWQPIKKALSHRPFNADSEEYKSFIAKARTDEEAFCKRWKL